MSKKIALASDHGGFDLKNLLVEKLKKDGYDVLDLGTHTKDSVDYPDIAALMADAIKTERRNAVFCCAERELESALRQTVFPLFVRR